ncbi:hypothetical protein ATE84_4104 [Aquimarina sp. MAR_2010_214]|uniref:hypothetical protein n=1 Tax=Aquimarina sp. MAR_2010_214 TaxID=1250026 RepID=UPI000C6FFBD9|nr:hypothetical protein [Aquimarina sp. MAR_2010_214]PKV52003.1 hypothetical protein ATE84_4104 [Aquimarina sp. MAR_2010_214]
MKVSVLKLVCGIIFFFSISNILAQEEGYNEKYQLKKINNELKKHYNSKDTKKYFYELMLIKNDTLRVKKFSHLPTTYNIHVWDELYVPMKEIDIKSIKYKKGILIKTKGNKKIIGDYLNKKSSAKKYYGFKVHVWGTKNEDKEVMEMIKILFKNH